MIKNHYQKELLLSSTQRRNGSQNTSKDVKMIQSWLCIQELNFPGSGTYTSVDGDFGPATEKVVKRFQVLKGLSNTGIVSQNLFDILSAPLKTAFETPLAGTDLRSLIVEAANNQLMQRPIELNINGEGNMGPWVRSYMDGHQGEDFLWCAGFVQTILDLAFSALGKEFTKAMPKTYDCDVIGNEGLRLNSLIRRNDYLMDPFKVKKGDVFLLRKSMRNWTHTGIIVNIGRETFTTIEGNADRDGSTNNGVAVYLRERNFITKKIDIFSMDQWA